MSGTYRDLVVWQKSMRLCLAVYRASEAFPGAERFGLAAELRKTARSIAANIAEGNRHRSRRVYLRHLDIANGSVAELETQLLLAQALGYEGITDLLAGVREVDAMLNALIRALRAWRKKEGT